MMKFQKKTPQCEAQMFDGTAPRAAQLAAMLGATGFAYNANPAAVTLNYADEDGTSQTITATTSQYLVLLEDGPVVMDGDKFNQTYVASE